jgi:electron transport complex protein RnfD
MLDVLIALLPATVMAIVFYGYKVAVLAVVCCLSACAAELCFGIVKNLKFKWKDIKEGVKSSSVWDCSCFVTGLLLALNLSTETPWWLALLGSVFAIVIVKMLFGGIGRNFINPALAGRIFVLLCLVRALNAVAPGTSWLGEQATAATWLGERSAENIKLLPMLIGETGTAAVGETSAIALLIGGIYLAVRRVIDWKIPVVILAGTALFALLFDAIPNAPAAQWGSVVAAHLLSGGLLLGALFMATDYATSPNTTVGTVIYACGIALLVVVIRVFSALPEGVSFAIVIMNIVAVLLDRYLRPRYFGEPKPEKKAKAKEVEA